MRARRLLPLLLCVALGAALLPLPARGGVPPAKDARQRRIDLPERDGGGEYLLFASDAAADAWYVLPIDARVVLREGKDGPEPDLELVKFQRVDPRDPEKLEQGALLQLAVALAPTEAAKKALADRLARETGAKAVSLSLLPIRAAALRIDVSPGAPPIRVEPLRGIGPLSSYGAFRFGVTLDHAAARLAEEIVTSSAGLVYALELTAEVPLGRSAAGSGATGGGGTAPVRLLTEARPFRLPGAIGLSTLPPAIRDRLVRDEARAFFERARLILPSIADDPELGVDRIQLDVVPVTPDMVERAPIQVFTWTPASGRFLDATGEAVLCARFDLPPIREKIGNAKLSDLRFKLTRSFEFSWQDARDRRKTGRFKEFGFQPVFDGEAPVSTPLTAADVLVVDPGSLTWRGVELSGAGAGASELESVVVTVKAGNYTVERLVKPRAGKGDSRLRPPGDAYVLVPRERRKPIEAAVEFRLAGGGKVPWRNMSGEDPDGTLYISLFDGDWRDEGSP